MSILELARAGNDEPSLGLKGKAEGTVTRTLVRTARGKNCPQGAMAFNRGIRLACNLSGKLLRNAYPNLTLLPTVIFFLP